MEQEPNCLINCNAACCRNAKYFSFSLTERERLELENITCTPCSLLTPNGTCSNYENRFDACRKFKSGSKDCLRFRAENPHNVIALTKQDIDFQEWYFGWSNYD